MALADLALLVVYLCVVVYFLQRFSRFRKPPSLGIALLPTGWLILALAHDLNRPIMVTLKWVGVLIGVALLASVIYADRSEKRR